jgi:hypothetical protein
MTTHSIYSDDPDIQQAIVACIDDMIANPPPESESPTQVRAFVLKALPIRVTVNRGVLCGVETWEKVGGGLQRVATDYTCYVCREPIADDPHTFHEEGCPMRDERPCAQAMCLQLSGCGEDCHDECCPTCTGQAFEPDLDAPVLGREAVTA